MADVEVPERGTPICPADQIPEGAVRMFALGDPALTFKLLVLRSGERYLGYRNRCPHFGIPLAAKDEQLIFNSRISVTCNTHYARFRWEDGFCEFGDCMGESLESVALAVVDGVLRFA